MTVKSINKHVCANCGLRKENNCPVPDSCPSDVFRQGKDGAPFVAYPNDCQHCFLCVRDCSLGAIVVSSIGDWPILAY